MLNFSIYSNAFNWLINLKKDLLKARSLEYILIIAVTISLIFGFVIFLIDPNIHSMGDGIWYAWVTMTHVGYGDIVPSSFLGRLMGALLIVFGVGMFALFTASLSAALIGRDLGSVKKEMEIVERETRDIEQEESLLIKEIARLHERLDKLESSLTDRLKVK
jgi:voltage-gated potassium channel Kch